MSIVPFLVMVDDQNKRVNRMSNMALSECFFYPHGGIRILEGFVFTTFVPPLHLFVRSTITVFRHRTKEQSDFRVWNYQLIRYAGYKMSDGTIIGDPDGVEFTEVRARFGHGCVYTWVWLELLQSYWPHPLSVS